MDISAIYEFVFGGKGSDILFACLAIIGGLKVIARYTPFAWDDQILDKADAPIRWLLSKIRPSQKEGDK